MYFTVIITLLFGYVIINQIKKYLSPLRKLPRPYSYPILGHFPQFFKAKGDLSVILDWCKEFQDAGMFLMNLKIAVVDEVVVLLKSEDVKTVLSKPDIFPRSKFVSTFVPLLGKGLLNSTGDDHRFQKKFFAKAFTMTNMKNFIPVFNRHAGILTEVMEEAGKNEENGKNLTVVDFFGNMTMDAIGELSFGFHFNSQRTENVLGNLFRSYMGGLLDMKGRLILKMFPIAWYMPFGPAKFLKDTNKEIDKLLDEVISMRRKKLAEETLTETEKNDLLNLMIIEKVNTGAFTDQLIKDSAFTFLFAGQETTATGLPGVLLYMSKYPDLQEKVRNEINQHIQDIELMKLEELDKLTYTDAFIKESLRLFMPVPNNFRVSAVDQKFGDQLIPKGTGFWMPNHHLHDLDFENGKNFIPERFLGNGLKNGTMFTFGYGPFSCIGKHFALLEMKVTIVRLMKKLKFSIDDGNDIFRRRQLITLKLFPELQIRVKKLK